MSATNRGSARQPQDLYETPEWCTTAVCQYLRDSFGIRPKTILEPCVGRGQLLRVLVKEFHSSEFICNDLYSVVDRVDPSWIRKSSCLDFSGSLDILRYVLCDGSMVDLCMTNPPYSSAVLQKIIENGIALSKHCVMLLRVNWVTGGRSRDSFRKEYPCDILTMSKRPSFVKGSTDATEYCWAHWHEDVYNRKRWFIPLDDYIC